MIPRHNIFDPNSLRCTITGHYRIVICSALIIGALFVAIGCCTEKTSIQGTDSDDGVTMSATYNPDTTLLTLGIKNDRTESALVDKNLVFGFAIRPLDAEDKFIELNKRNTILQNRSQEKARFIAIHNGKTLERRLFLSKPNNCHFAAEAFPSGNISSSEEVGIYADPSQICRIIITYCDLPGYPEFQETAYDIPRGKVLRAQLRVVLTVR